MASHVYPLYKQAWITQGSTNLGLDGTVAPDVPCVVMSSKAEATGYNAAHQFFSSITGDVVPAAGLGVTIASPTVVGGLFNGNDVTFSSVSGSTIFSLIIFRKNSGANTTWRLFAFIDQPDVAGFSLIPNGGDITVTWANTPVAGIVQT